MKSLFLATAEEISAEIDRLIKKQVGLFCLFENKKTKELFVKGKAQAENGPLLVVDNQTGTDCASKSYLFFYQLPGEALRLRKGCPGKRVGTLVGLQYPTEIYEIQRRKFPRVPATSDSTVTFCVRNKQKFHIGRVDNVCMEGVKISGDFPVAISEGETLTPLTLRLLLKHAKDVETEVHIPEGRVVRVSGTDGFTNEVAIHFALPEKEQLYLANYVEIRALEESYAA